MRMFEKTSPGWLLLAAIAAAVGLAGCSGGEDDLPAEEGVIDLARGRFDPAVVYVVGRVRAKGCDKVVADPEAPESPVAGLPCGALEAVVRPTDGRLVYRASGDLGVLEPDPLSRREDGSWNYPHRVDDNDRLLDTGACATRAMDVGRIWVDPQGSIAYRCNQEEEKPALHVVDGETIQLRGDGGVLALGTEGRALVYGDRGQRRKRLMIESAERSVKVHTGSWTLPYAARADAEGFLLVVGPWTSEDRREGLGELHRVRYDGSTELRALYAGWPADLGEDIQFTLAADGTLYAVATRRRGRRKPPSEALDGTLLRFRTDRSAPEVVLRHDGPNPLFRLQLIESAGGASQPRDDRSEEQASRYSTGRPS